MWAGQEVEECGRKLVVFQHRAPTEGVVHMGGAACAFGVVCAPRIVCGEEGWVDTPLNKGEKADSSDPICSSVAACTELGGPICDPTPTCAYNTISFVWTTVPHRQPRRGRPTMSLPACMQLAGPPLIMTDP